jgi:transcriptional pleiotropic regulator of transition state genes
VARYDRHIDLIIKFIYTFFGSYDKGVMNMKSIGIVRKVDELGRIVLPIELRRTLDIAEKDPLEIYVEGDSIVLRKFQSACVLCGSTKGITSFRDKNICAECIRLLAEKP